MRPIAAFTFAAVLGAFWSAPSFADQPQPIAPDEWITAADNLPEAGRLGLDGTVSVELDVGATGQVTACRVVKSTGHEMLDEHTCRLLSSRAQFKPATDENGRPVAGVFPHTLVWQVVTNANWAANGAVTAKMIADSVSGTAPECIAETVGEISDYMKQMACFILVNQAKNIVAARAAELQGPLGVAFVLAVSPEDADSLARKGINGDWQQVGYTNATVTVSPEGQRTDCRMVETKGASTLLFPTCEALAAFRYVPQKDPMGANAATELHQVVAYYIEGSAGS